MNKILNLFKKNKYLIFAALILIIISVLWRNGVETEVKIEEFEDIERNLSRVHLDPPAYNNVEVLYKKAPYICRLRDFLDPRECQHIIDLCNERFKRSEVTGDKVGENNVELSRTSYSCHMKKAETDIIKEIERKASKVCGVPIDNIEPLQVVRYYPQQKYDAHNDWFYDNKLKNQRYKTILVYLNDDFEGGSTDFVHNDVKVKAVPKRGDGIFWYNCWKPPNSNGHSESKCAGDCLCFEQSLHQGSPPTKGVKYALNIWVRFKKY